VTHYFLGRKEKKERKRGKIFFFLYILGEKEGRGQGCGEKTGLIKEEKPLFRAIISEKGKGRKGWTSADYREEGKRLMLISSMKKETKSPLGTAERMERINGRVLNPRKKKICVNVP